jgi:hypothetical protein
VTKCLILEHDIGEWYDETINHDKQRLEQLDEYQHSYEYNGYQKSHGKKIQQTKYGQHFNLS